MLGEGTWGGRSFDGSGELWVGAEFHQPIVAVNASYQEANRLAGQVVLEKRTGDGQWVQTQVLKQKDPDAD